MGIFTAAETEVDLYLHILAKEVYGTRELEIKIMLFATGTKLDFLCLVYVSCFFILLFFLGFIVLELAEITNLTNRRLRTACDFHKIEPVLLSQRNGFARFHHADLCSVCPHNANLPDANVIVDASAGHPPPSSSKTGTTQSWF